MITGRQIRAARALLDWTAVDLAEKSGLTRETVSRIEAEVVKGKEDSVDRIRNVFDANGVEFLDQSGVRQKSDRVREIEGSDCYARLLDEIFYLLDKDEEFLVAWADETLSPDAVHGAYQRIVNKGILYRKLIRQGNRHICGPLDWYHYVDPNYYQNATAVFFRDKSAYLTEDWKKVVILKDRSLAEANKNFFNMIWNSTIAPGESTSNVKYHAK